MATPRNTFSLFPVKSVSYSYFHVNRTQRPSQTPLSLVRRGAGGEVHLPEKCCKSYPCELIFSRKRRAASAGDLAL